MTMNKKERRKFIGQKPLDKLKHILQVKTICLINGFVFIVPLGLINTMT